MTSYSESTSRTASTTLLCAASAGWFNGVLNNTPRELLRKNSISTTPHILRASTLLFSYTAFENQLKGRVRQELEAPIAGALSGTTLAASLSLTKGVSMKAFVPSITDKHRLDIVRLRYKHALPSIRWGYSLYSVIRSSIFFSSFFTAAPLISEKLNRNDGEGSAPFVAKNLIAGVGAGTVASVMANPIRMISGQGMGLCRRGGILGGILYTCFMGGLSIQNNESRSKWLEANKKP